MRDGMTRKQKTSAPEDAAEALLRGYRSSLIVLHGKAPGHEYELKAPRTLIGRGPGVHVAVADEAMSRQHFAVEVAAGVFRVRDLGSTNGVLLNGKAVDDADLEHGDHVKAGDHEFQFLLEKIEREPRTYVVPE